MRITIKSTYGIVSKVEGKAHVNFLYSLQGECECVIQFLTNMGDECQIKVTVLKKFYYLFD